MAAELVTPTDEVTGLPHPIMPYDVPSGEVNYHHHFFPRRELEPRLWTRDGLRIAPEDLSLDGIASLAVRMSRGQVLPIMVHNAAHRRFLGPRLPQTLDEKFETTIKACAGVVSRWAIDVRKPEKDVLVYMDEDTFVKVVSTRVLCTERAYYDRPPDYRRRVFGSFLVRYALEQDLSHVSPRVVEQFLEALEVEDEVRKLELGNFILKEALDLKIAPIVPVHQDLKRKGFVQPGRVDIRKVVRKLIHKDRLPAYFPALGNKLLATAS